MFKAFFPPFYVCVPKNTHISLRFKNAHTFKYSILSVLIIRKQNQWFGQKNGKAVCGKISEETSRGRQHLTSEERWSAETDGETMENNSYWSNSTIVESRVWNFPGLPLAWRRDEWIFGWTVSLTVLILPARTVHRPRRQQRLHGVVLGRETRHF